MQEDFCALCVSSAITGTHLDLSLSTYQYLGKSTVRNMRSGVFQTFSAVRDPQNLNFATEFWGIRVCVVCINVCGVCRSGVSVYDLYKGPVEGEL